MICINYGNSYEFDPATDENTPKKPRMGLERFWKTPGEDAAVPDDGSPSTNCNADEIPLESEWKEVDTPTKDKDPGLAPKPGPAPSPGSGGAPAPAAAALPEGMKQLEQLNDDMIVCWNEKDLIIFSKAKTNKKLNQTLLVKVREGRLETSGSFAWVFETSKELVYQVMPDKSFTLKSIKDLAAEHKLTGIQKHGSAFKPGQPPAKLTVPNPKLFLGSLPILDNP